MDRLPLLDKFDRDGQLLFKMKRETNPAAMTHLVPTSCRQLISESDLFEITHTVNCPSRVPSPAARNRLHRLHSF